MAKIIIEADLEHFQVDCSLGSHFFHNVIAMNIGYFSLPWKGEKSYINWNGIRNLPVVSRTGYAVHARTDKPFHVLMDGTQSKGIITMPGIGIPTDSVSACP